MVVEATVWGRWPKDHEWKEGKSHCSEEPQHLNGGRGTTRRKSERWELLLKSTEWVQQVDQVRYGVNGYGRTPVTTGVIIKISAWLIHGIINTLHTGRGTRLEWVEVGEGNDITKVTAEFFTMELLNSEPPPQHKAIPSCLQHPGLLTPPCQITAVCEHLRELPWAFQQLWVGLRALWHRH